MCLAQGPQRNDAGEAWTAALQFRVKRSTTEPLRSRLQRFSAEDKGKDLIYNCP